ncbi:histidine kinase [Beutenbergia cavernae DSM 12333]|uniref:histidine kinase n=1 Tax=Beutenbergia cavernae (strain ATCC BAA-8 / DSM 12333 / CCUG 43141 / JCM 11478 / NBRC 16432 / NCIMB 13614 / HKI 0122) TaxID=471853 RepID=C5C5A4_BEUC1|nr:histidine kinase [Beutenbergia cavernae]ACQ82244.1 histidine kinase [Beutenbergia cavernae DSM 12333]
MAPDETEGGDVVTPAAARPAPPAADRVGAPRVTPLDVILAVAVTATVAAAIATSREEVAGSPALGYVFAAAFGALMFVRRTQPVIVVVATSLGLIWYYASGLPSIGLAVPVAAALYSAAEAGRTLVAILAAVALLLFTYAYRIGAGQDAAYLLGYELATNVAIMAAAIALGDGQRSRRRLLAEQREVARRREAEREAEAARRVADERLRIARDLHDSVGHTVVAVSLHADVAAEALAAGEPDAAARSLALARSAAADSMRELRASVGLLRDGGAHLDLDRVLLAARDGGLVVDADVDAGLADSVPPEVWAAGVRIVQESLTNVLRHSGAEHVSVAVHEADDVVELEVRDDGARAAATGSEAASQPSGGHGIRGMRERAEELGGTLDAGPPGGGDGWVVAAVLPLPPPSADGTEENP